MISPTLLVDNDYLDICSEFKSKWKLELLGVGTPVLGK